MILILSRTCMHLVAFAFLALWSNKVYSQCNGTVDVNDDIILCEPGIVNLDGTLTGDFIFFNWTSDNGYENSSSLTPSVFVDTDTEFKLTAHFIDPLAPNLIDNGDFENGNTGFTTQYTYVPNPAPMAMWNEGTYTVGSNPNSYHSNFASCGDHTSGTGDMMIFNGSSTLSIMWCQTINVDPNTYYIFDAWATSVISSSPAKLQFSINGGLIGTSFQLPSSVCDWQNFHAIWFSGNETSVDICITNQNTQQSGNDFALDDISFTKSCIAEDSFLVDIIEFDAEIIGDELLNCYLPTDTLYGIITPGNGNYNYSWSSFDGDYSDGESEDQIVIFSSGTYFLQVTDENNCTKLIDVFVDEDTELPEPILYITDSLDCTGEPIIIFCETNDPFGNTYYWNGPNNFDSEEQNPEVFYSGLYNVTVTNADNGCQEISSIDIPINDNLPVFDIAANGNLTCNNNQVILSTSYNNQGSTYAWTGSGIASNPNLQSVDVNKVGNYQLEITDANGCVAKKSINVTMLPSQLNYALANQDVITCNNDSIQLNLTISGNVDSVNWNGVGGFYSTNFNPTITQAGVYYLSAYDSNGCLLNDTISISEDKNVLLPSIATSPINCITNNGSFFIHNSNSSYNYIFENNIIADSTLISINEANNYELFIQAVNGCIDSLDFQITRDQDFPKNEISFNHISCNDRICNVNLQTNIDSVTYQWTGTNLYASSEQNPSLVNGGVYHLETISKKGCRTIDSIFVEVDTISPIIDVQVENITCINSIVSPTFNVSFATEYDLQWTGPNNFNSTDAYPNFNTQGNYIVNIIAENGCSSNTVFDVLENLEKPLTTINGLDILNCKVKELEISFNQNINYQFQKWISNNKEIKTSTLDIDKIGTYHLIGSHPISGCFDTLTFSVLEDLEKPKITVIGIDTITCTNQFIDLNCTVEPLNSSFEWNINADIYKNDFTIQVDEAGNNYFLTSTHSATFCTDTIFFEIQADTISPKFEIETSVITCDKPFADISIFSSDNSNQYTFSSNDISLISNKKYQTDKAGNYSVIGKANNGCTSQLAFEIVENKKTPQFEVTYEDLDCTNKSKSIIVDKENSTFGTQTSIINSKGVIYNSDSISINTTGTYTIIVENNDNGCITEKEINVIKKDDGPKAILYDVPFLCEEKSYYIAFEKVIAGSSPYQYLLNGISFKKEELNHKTLSEGKYELRIIDSKGCETDTSFIVANYTQVIPEIIPQISINYGAEIELEIDIIEGREEIENISWFPTTYLSCSDCFVTNCTPENDIEYTITITDKMGCPQEITANVRVIYDVNIRYPNIIRHDDNDNGKFTIYGTSTIEKVNYLKVFDRWGSQVFLQNDFPINDPSYGWDGNANGNQLVNGVYAFVTEVTTIKGEKLLFFGDVTLVK